MKAKILLALGMAVAVAGFVLTGIFLAYRFDPELERYVWAIPRDALFQWHTTLSAIMVAAALAGFLPMNWSDLFKPKRNNVNVPVPVRIASVACLTALWLAVFLRDGAALND